MGKQSGMMKIANRMAQSIIADQTRARVALGFDAAIIAARSIQDGAGALCGFCNGL